MVNFLRIIDIENKEIVINIHHIVGLYRRGNSCFVVTEGSYTTYLSDEVFEKLKKYLMGEFI